MSVEAQAEKLHFQAEVKQLLNIVIHSLYSNKEIFLRELISNASDAIDKLRFEALSNAAIYEKDSELKIRVTFDAEAKTLTISDNGIGMSREYAINHLGTIAKSGTREFMEKLTGDQQKDAHLIGQFGVGFYSAFMVADKVTVHTRLAGSSPELGVSWESAGDGEYEIHNIEKKTRGTDVILHLKESEHEFLNDWRIRSIITKYSDHLNTPIEMLKRGEDEKPTTEWETVNRATALWILPKSKITDDQYQAFYKHISHDFNDALSWAHHKIEGSAIEYICLLYLPSEAPFDLWQQNAKHGLKLYVQRVFIMDQVEQLLPNYLRFVRGVLDTSALPLNVSREILQDHHVLPKLRSALVRHVLDWLDKLVDSEPAKYQTFWKSFGNVLKEGTAEDFVNRDRVAKLLRFSSTHDVSSVQTVSFDDYIKRMKDKQTKIYYITADNLVAAQSSPHLEVFRKNQIEVLLLTDKIDEWVVSHLSTYAEKPLQSVAKGDFALDDLVDQNEDAKKEAEAKDEAMSKAYDGLIKAMNALLVDKVKEVRLSHRLTSSPSCLVRDDHALGPQMERLLKAAGQQVTESKPVLELNPEHTLVKTLNGQLTSHQFTDWATLLYEQAMLAEGSPLQDPASFVQRMNKLWVESL